MCISDVSQLFCVRGFHYDFPGVSSCPTAKTQLWMSVFTFSQTFPQAGGRQLSSTALCTRGKPAASSSSTKVWGAGREQAPGSGCAQEGGSLPAGICTRAELLFMGVEGWWGDGCSEPAAVVSASPSVSGIQGFNPGAEGKSILILKKIQLLKLVELSNRWVSGVGRDV